MNWQALDQVRDAYDTARATVEQSLGALRETAAEQSAAAASTLTNSSSSAILAGLAPKIMNRRHLDMYQGLTEVKSSFTPGTLSRSKSHRVPLAEDILQLEIPEPSDAVPLRDAFAAFHRELTARSSRKERRRRRAAFLERASGIDVAAKEKRLLHDISDKEQQDAYLGKTTVQQLQQDMHDIEDDLRNTHIRGDVLRTEIEAITQRIVDLHNHQKRLTADILALREEEVELEDERVQVQLQIDSRVTFADDQPVVSSPTVLYPPSSTRLAYLPRRHDELPVNEVFMTLTHDGDESPVNFASFTAPYDLGVAASDYSTSVWDLAQGTHLGFLQPQASPTSFLHVTPHAAFLGTANGDLMLFDLSSIHADAEQSIVSEYSMPSIPSDNGSNYDVSLRDTDSLAGPKFSIKAHTKPLTALDVDVNAHTAVSGASDRIMRLWDLNTGTCSLTMDIQSSLSADDQASFVMEKSFSSLGLGRPSLNFKSDPLSHFEYLDALGTQRNFNRFVGGIQYLDYALLSGTADGAIRMWDLRSGIASRSLLGHTAPITSVHFDEYQIVSSSLDRTVRVWDLRTGGISDTLHFDYPVTDIQFDRRRIVAAASDNAVHLYNRTSHKRHTLHGHHGVVNSVQFVDKYLMSAADDAVMVWAI